MHVFPLVPRRKVEFPPALEAYVKKVLATETGTRLVKLKKILNERLVTLSQMGKLADVDWDNEPMLMYVLGGRVR